MATLGGTWANSYLAVQTEAGIFRAAYAPGPREEVVIAGPGDETRTVKTPHLGGFALTVEGNKLCVWYLELPAQVERRIDTGIVCGQRVMAMLPQATGPLGPAGAPGPKGDTGPQGPPGAAGAAGDDAVALTDADIDRIAQRVWTMPPPPELKNISGVDLGTLAQEVIAYIDTQRQDAWQLKVRKIDEAVVNLVAGGYQPQAK